jgi:hypothetical protein
MSGHLAKNQQDARISCKWRQATATCAALIEEGRMKFIAGESLRKSGGVGYPSFVREPEPLRKECYRGCIDLSP